MSKYRVIEEENTKNTDTKVETKHDAKPKKPKKQKEKGKLKRKVTETFAELKNVTWPSFGSVLTKTGIVLAFCAGSLVLLFTT